MTEVEAIGSNDYVDVENAAGSNKESLLNFRYITMELLQRICRLQCTEWVGGHYKSTTQMVGSLPTTMKVWIPDSRMAYINGVMALYNLTASHIVKHKPTKKKSIDHNAIIDAAFKKVDDGLFSLKTNDEAGRSVLLRDTHGLLRALVAFLNDKNLMTMVSEDDV